MALDTRGIGTINFTLSQAVLVPEHNAPPTYTPEGPGPIVVIPESVTGTLVPINDPDAVATMTGSISINTTTIDAFAVGTEYVLTITAPA